MDLAQEIVKITLIGCGATGVMDIWLLFLKRIGIHTLNFAFIGRWVGHVFFGRFTHTAIGKTSPIAHEALLGWITHYAVGIVFAFLLISVAGVEWIGKPSLGVALLVGICTVAFPFFVMQPAMGLGIASSKTPSPIKSCARSLINHSVFGIGLYLSAVVIESLSR